MGIACAVLPPTVASRVAFGDALGIRRSLRDIPRAEGATAGAFIVFALSLCLYGLMLQSHPYGDGIIYLWSVGKGSVVSQHLLFVPTLLGFVRALEALGVGERVAASLFSVFCGAAGHALLYLWLRPRTQGRAGLTVLFVATSPVVLFFATTLENHVPHYAAVCLALWLAGRALDRGTASAWLLAGVGLAVVPASHQTGWMLLPGLVLLTWCAEGERPILRRPDRGEFLALILYLMPTLACLVKRTDLENWLFGPGDRIHTADPVAVLETVLAQRPAFDVMLGQLVRGWFLPAVGIWSAFLLLLFELRRQQPRLLLCATLPLLVYLPVVLLFQIHEGGGYFIAILPLAAGVLARLRLRPLGRRLRVWFVALMLPTQCFLGLARIASHPDPNLAAPWDWAQDAARAAAGEVAQGERPSFLCADVFRLCHLEYEHGIEARLMPFLLERIDVAIDEGEVDDARLDAFLRAELGELLETGPVLFAEGVRRQVERKHGRIWESLKRCFTLREIASGEFHGWRVVPR